MQNSLRSGIMISISGEIHSSKNSRRIFINRKTGNPFVAKSRVSKLDEEILYVQLESQKDKWFQMIGANPIFPLSIIFRFRRETKRRFDYVNIVQGVLDAMVKVGYIEDDNANYVIPLFAPYVVDKENPGCDFVVENSGYVVEEIKEHFTRR